MQFLYPCNPCETKKPDEAYEEEFLAMQLAGFLCLLYSAEDFEGGDFKPRPVFLAGDDVIYRGWMQKPDDYAKLIFAIESKDAKALTSPLQYRRCHYLP